MTGSYPPGCTQRDHDRAFKDWGPDPDEERRREEAELDWWWDELFAYFEDGEPSCETLSEPLD